MSEARPLPSSEAPVISKLIHALADLAVYRIIDNSHQDWINRELQLDDMRLQLLDAVMAHRHSLDAAGHSVALRDVKRQLKAMLKLDDAVLLKAIEDCDTRTYTAIEAAERAIWRTPADVYRMGALATTRRAIEIALANAQAQDAKRGPKEKDSQHELARTCCEVWSEHKPAGARGRPAFIRTVFEAAGMPLSDKRLEALAAQVTPPTQKEVELSRENFP